MSVKKILVVDDSPTDRTILRELLGKKGYQVITRRERRGGVAKAKADPPDLILMDVVMPG